MEPEDFAEFCGLFEDGKGYGNGDDLGDRFGYGRGYGYGDGGGYGNGGSNCGNRDGKGIGY